MATLEVTGFSTLEVDLSTEDDVRRDFIRTSESKSSKHMGILSDTQIEKLVKIEPFEKAGKRLGKISYGVTSYGYDVRVGTAFKVFTNVNSWIVDPKAFDPKSFVDVDAGHTGFIL
ncbi:MAG: hypothetical protein WCO71_13345, partial [Pseudomonadota bacterium]